MHGKDHGLTSGADRSPARPAAEHFGKVKPASAAGVGGAGGKGGDASLRESPTALSPYPPRAGAVCWAEAGGGRGAGGWLAGRAGGEAGQPRRGEPGVSELWDVVERGRATPRSAHSSWASHTLRLCLCGLS